MSIENHKIKRNQELNRDLMKRWGFSPPESTEEVVTTEVDVEKQEPVVEASETVRNLIIEAAQEAGVKFEGNEIDEIIGEMIEEGFFDRFRAGKAGREAAKAAKPGVGQRLGRGWDAIMGKNLEDLPDAEIEKLTAQAKSITDSYVKKLEDLAGDLESDAAKMGLDTDSVDKAIKPIKNASEFLKILGVKRAMTDTETADLGKTKADREADDLKLDPDSSEDQDLAKGLNQSFLSKLGL